MSYDADFIFNIPDRYKDPVDFTESLKSDLGLSFNERNEYGVWVGNHLGFLISFDPNHGIEDDGDVPFESFISKIGVCGYTGQSVLRVILLQELIHIAMAVCFKYRLEGVVVWECSQKIIHLGISTDEGYITNLDTKRPIKEYSDLKDCMVIGVKY